jgi:hypothetical protein
MQTTNSESESKRKRRRGDLAAEIARDAKCSYYKAKQVNKIVKHAPELGPLIIRGELKIREAIKLLDIAPETIPLIASGKLNLADCLQAIREGIAEAEAEQSFEEKVEESFARWLDRWPKDETTRRQIWSLIDNAFEL